ncbi:jerky protein homolog-like [Anoplophora glabripennis]|uniref:jerky protein homolog-like n=1 Tax=Anoplophora glabripennis TaxID=217634 RepID=UPI0008743B95|nr:jerky protein homolog-like [Anoplophora glabripennis]
MVVPRNTKRVERVQNHSRISISIMVCGNVKGDLLPPMVYKSSNLYENWPEGGPPGTKYASSLSGWFDMNLFEMWYFKILLPHIKETRKEGATTIVAGDNLASHFSPAVNQSYKEHGIYITPFPANATHLMQPLDVAVFGPMKKCWRKILDNCRKESQYPGKFSQRAVSKFAL